MGEADLGTEVGAAPVDRVHQVVPLHRRVQNTSERNCGGVVDLNSDSYENQTLISKNLIQI